MDDEGVGEFSGRKSVTEKLKKHNQMDWIRVVNYLSLCGRNCTERNYIWIKMRTGFHSPVESGSFYAVVSETSGIGKNMSDSSGRLMDLLPVI